MRREGGNMRREGGIVRREGGYYEPIVWSYCS